MSQSCKPATGLGAGPGADWPLCAENGSTWLLHAGSVAVLPARMGEAWPIRQFEDGALPRSTPKILPSFLHPQCEEIHTNVKKCIHRRQDSWCRPGLPIMR